MSSVGSCACVCMWYVPTLAYLWYLVTKIITENHRACDDEDRRPPTHRGVGRRIFPVIDATRQTPRRRSTVVDFDAASGVWAARGESAHARVVVVSSRLLDDPRRRRV